MVHLEGEERSRYVRGMFARIAGRYDLMNRLMTGWQDVRWRRQMMRGVRLSPGGRLLDLGAGTGDLAREALRRFPGCRPVAADFTLEMMRVGKARSGLARLDWCAADAACLPFAEGAFEAVVSGFLLRNVSDLPGALAEQRRVLAPGGWMLALDTTRPRRSLLYPLIDFYLRRVIPALGRLVTGQREAYTYLPDSTRNFLSAERLAELMQAAGFQQVGFRRVGLGAVAIHWGRKEQARANPGDEAAG